MRKMITIECLKAGPVRGVSAWAGKWMARAKIIQILPARAVALWPSQRESLFRRQIFYVFFCISGHSEHFLFLGEKS